VTDPRLLARPEILALTPYESARSLALRGEIFLDANEAPASPFPDSRLNRYPEPQPLALVERFSSYYGVNSEQMVITRGSDEAIDLLMRVFCRPGSDQILICPPTYGMYEVSAKIQGAGIIRVPLKKDDFALDVGAIGAELARTPNLKLVFLCSPNNPTGGVFPREALNAVCRLADGKALVVVDEAYGEFSGDSMIQSVPSYPHLVVLRTLSKAWALAGVRCGVAIGQKPLIDLLQKVRPPYPLSAPAVQTALQGTDTQGLQLLKERIAEIQSEREKLREELLQLKEVRTVFPSNANFLLVRFEKSGQVFEALRARGTILRDRSRELGLEGCIRITVGSPPENRILISQIREATREVGTS